MLRCTMFVVIAALTVGCRSSDHLVSSPPTQTPASAAPRQAVPAKGFCTTTLYSPDGRIIVTVDRPLPEVPHHLTAASQISIRDTLINRERVFSWGQDGPYSVSFPIITDVINIDASRYLLLGWSANSVQDVALTAWLVQAKPDDLQITELATIEGPGVKLVVHAHKLGLFRPSTTKTVSVSVMGLDRSVDCAASTDHAPVHAGYWYTRPAVIEDDPTSGNVLWVELKPSDVKER